MKKYKKRPVPLEYELVRAQQIQESDFTADHPNADHVIGVTYDPKKMTASIGPKKSEQVGTIGDYIVVDGDQVTIVKQDAFEAEFEPT